MIIIKEGVWRRTINKSQTEFENFRQFILKKYCFSNIYIHPQKMVTLNYSEIRNMDFTILDTIKSKCFRKT